MDYDEARREYNETMARTVSPDQPLLRLRVRESMEPIMHQIIEVLHGDEVIGLLDGVTDVSYKMRHGHFGQLTVALDTKDAEVATYGR
jgi:hypothetical protein